MAYMPVVTTYSSVVMRETVCIALTMATLHELETKAADLNAYGEMPSKEKKWTVQGLKFGDDAAKSVLIDRALYGLKRTGALLRPYLEQYMKE